MGCYINARFSYIIMIINFTKISNELLKKSNLSNFELFKSEYLNNFIVSDFYKKFNYGHYYSNKLLDFEKQDLIYLFLVSNCKSKLQLDKRIKEEYINKHLDKKYINKNIYKDILTEVNNKLIQNVNKIDILKEYQKKEILFNVYLLINKSLEIVKVLHDSEKFTITKLQQLDPESKETVAEAYLFKNKDFINIDKTLDNFITDQFEEGEVSAMDMLNIYLCLTENSIEGESLIKNTNNAVQKFNLMFSIQDIITNENSLDLLFNLLFGVTDEVLLKETLINIIFANPSESIVNYKNFILKTLNLNPPTDKFILEKIVDLFEPIDKKYTNIINLLKIK